MGQRGNLFILFALYVWLQKQNNMTKIQDLKVVYYSDELYIIKQCNYNVINKPGE